MNTPINKIISNLLLIVGFCFTGYTFSQRNCSVLSTSLTPIEDLGTATYLGLQGGQYPSGSNSRPQLQLTRALNQANSITPLNALGAVDLINGKVAMIGIGASNPRTEFASFQSYCDTFQCLNKKLEVVNVCKGGIGIQKMNYDTAAYWIKANDTLVAHSLTSLQVQIVWIEQEHTQSTNTIFPNAPQQLIADYKKLLEIILIKYPNVKMAYINSRAYAGYTDNSTGAGLRAPRDYYNSWAVKWLIENQINNVAGYEYAGANANIPFIDWATNSWANGNIPKQDGLFWDCVNDFGITDGLHLSPNGEMKVGKRLFGYFSMDTTAKVWFIDATCKAITTHLGPKDIRVDNMLIYPNPVSDKLIISYKGSFGYKIYNSFGMIIVDGQHHNENSLIDVTSFEKGIYLIRTNGEINLVKTIIIN